ncbi:hypothetical protein [Streptomyces sp. NPDC097619]|uniref:hypothetical protein n=1 Tax=Streptomyces sp. NPDC097619 TaxID=3157228 RepID=UPI0033340863
MGNSTAYAVFRTGDAATAYAKARQLCALLSYPEDFIWVSAELLTVEDVRRMAAVLPEARFGHMGIRTGPEGEDLWFDLDVMTADDRALEPHLPLEIVAEHVPAELADRFVAGDGGHVGRADGRSGRQDVRPGRGVEVGGRIGGGSGGTGSRLPVVRGRWWGLW